MRAEPVEIRKEALDYAKGLFADDDHPGPERLIQVAADVAEFWTTPCVIRIRVGLIRTNDGSGTRAQEGSPMQLHDNEEVDYVVEALDAKGYQVSGESFSASSSDESVVTVTQAGSTFTATAGAPGSATLTFTDGTLTATEAVDVVPGDVATIQVTAGDVRDQAPAVAPVDAGTPVDAPADPGTI